MIGDMVQTSEGSQRTDNSRSLVANFASPARAATAARRIQHAVREFAQHRPESCVGVSISIHPPATPRAVGDPDPNELALQRAEPGQILVASETYAALYSLPGLEFRATAASSGLDRELIWTTPENYQWFRELFEKSKKNAPAADESTTAEIPYTATRIWMPETPTTPGEIHTGTAERSIAADVSEYPIEESRIPGSIRRWWWAAATVMVLILVAVLFLFPSGGKRRNTAPAQLQQAPPPQNVNVPASSENHVVTPVATSEEKPNTEAPLATAQPEVPNTPALESPKHSNSQAENSKKETNATMLKRGVVDYDGFTVREIPQLLRRADADAGAGNYEQARREYEIVLKLDPGNLTAKQGLHRVDLREHETQ
jgi:hypothetical protein